MRTEAEGGIRILSRPLSPTVSFEATAVFIYLFRDEGTDNLALTIDVTSRYSTHHALN